MTATIYNTEPAPSPETGRTPGTVRVARYARGEDYHVVLADRLEALLAWMRDGHPEPFRAVVFVDKHHVQERGTPAMRVSGGSARHLPDRARTSAPGFFSPGMATASPLEPDAPGFDQGGAGALCLDACPMARSSIRTCSR